MQKLIITNLIGEERGALISCAIFYFSTQPTTYLPFFMQSTTNHSRLDSTKFIFFQKWTYLLRFKTQNPLKHVEHLTSNTLVASNNKSTTLKLSTRKDDHV